MQQDVCVRGATVEQSQARSGLVGHYLSPSLGRGSREVVIALITQGEQSGHDRKSVLPRGWSVLRRLCCPLPWGQFPLFLLISLLSVSPVNSKVAAR
jgi:hypothetical protein